MFEIFKPNFTTFIDLQWSCGINKNQKKDYCNVATAAIFASLQTSTKSPKAEEKVSPSKLPTAIRLKKLIFRKYNDSPRGTINKYKISLKVI